MGTSWQKEGCLKDGILSSPHFCPPPAMALVGLLSSRSFFPGRFNKPGVRVWLSAYFPFCFLPHLLTRLFPPCLAHPFTPMSLAFAAFFNCPIITQELGSYLVLIYKYMNIKSLPSLSPHLTHHPVCSLPDLCSVGDLLERVIWGQGFSAS